jgi:hypothetical protein
VLEELYAGAGDRERRVVERLERDFDRVKRILVPNLSDWTQAGRVLARLAEKCGKVTAMAPGPDLLAPCNTRKLKLSLQLLGIFQKVADLTPYCRLQQLSLDLPIATNTFSSKTISVRSSASIVTIVLQAMAGASFASSLTVIGITTDCTAGKPL